MRDHEDRTDWSNDVFRGHRSVRARSCRACCNRPLGYLKGPASFDFQGNLYFADTTNNTIGKITADGVLSTIAGAGGSNAAPIPGPALSTHFAHPNSTATDTFGNVYVTDFANRRVEKITIPTPPSAPRNVTASLAGANIGLSWTAPAFGNPATSYTVTPTVNGIARPPITGISATSYTFIGPLAGAAYSLTVTQRRRCVYLR